MNSIDISSYKNLYLSTANEYVDSLLSSCNEILQNTPDLLKVKTMHLSAHSIKSQSQVMQYTKTAVLSGLIEKILKFFLDNNMPIADDLARMIKEAAEKIKSSLALIETQDKEEDLDEITKRLEEQFNALRP